MTVPEVIEPKILLIRGQKVMLDVDLASLYGVSTKRPNGQDPFASKPGGPRD